MHTHQFFIVIAFLAAAIPFSFASAQTGCLKYPSNSTSPVGYGVSWDVTSSLKELLIKSNCPTSGTSLDITIGKGNTSQYIWSTMYVYGGSNWTDYTLAGTSGGAGWLIGVGNKTVMMPFSATAENPLFFVGYVCTQVGSSWKCGCANASCTTQHWQLQAYTGTGGGGTGGGTGAEPGTLPTAPSYPGPTYYVSPSGSGISQSQSSPGNPATTIQGVDDGSIVVFLPGTYGSIVATNPKQSGRIKMISSVRAISSINTEKRTSVSYATAHTLVNGARTDGARITGEFKIWNFSEPWIEGFYLPQNAKGIELNEVNHGWVVRNYIYNMRTATGILANHINGSGGYVVSLENWITNTRRDLDDPEHDWEMDYGIRYYGTRTGNAYMNKNLILGGFNQPVSTKENFVNTYIENNVFVGGDCRCESDPGPAKNIMVGQEPDRGTDDRTSANVYIRGNTIRAKSQAMIIANVQNAIVENNNFIDATNVISQFFSSGCAGGCSAPVSQVGIVARSTIFRNNWINNNGKIEIWPRGNSSETLTVENNTVAGGGTNSIILHRSIVGTIDPDRPPTSTLTIPTVNRVGGDASGFSAQQITD